MNLVLQTFSHAFPWKFSAVSRYTKQNRNEGSKHQPQHPSFSMPWWRKRIGCEQKVPLVFPNKILPRKPDVWGIRTDGSAAKSSRCPIIEESLRSSPENNATPSHLWMSIYVYRAFHWTYDNHIFDTVHNSMNSMNPDLHHKLDPLQTMPYPSWPLLYVYPTLQRIPLSSWMSTWLRIPPQTMLHLSQPLVNFVHSSLQRVSLISWMSTIWWSEPNTRV